MPDSPAAAAAPAALPPGGLEGDSAARWESIRQRWLTPRPTSSDEDNDGAGGKCARAGARKQRPRDAVFQQRIHTLEQMLRASNAAATAPGATSGPGVVRAPPPPILSVPSSAFLSVQEDGGGSGAGSSGGSKGKERAVQDDDEEEPDGGMAIRDSGANGAHADPVHELKKVSEVRPLPSSFSSPSVTDGVALAVHLSRFQAGSTAEGASTFVTRRA